MQIVCNFLQLLESISVAKLLNICFTDAIEMDFKNFESSESELEFELQKDNFINLDAVVDENETQYDEINISG